MRNIKLVDYLGKKFRDEFDPLGGSDGGAPDDIIVGQYNSATDSRMTKTGQYEYYINHKEYGKDFMKIVKDLNKFSRKYPNLLKELFTTNDNKSGFNYILTTSDDEKEAYEWKKVFSGYKGDIEIPIRKKAIYCGNSSEGVYIIKNPNWRKLEDPERQNDDGDGFWATNSGGNKKFYGLQNQSAMDVLNAYLSNKEMIFTSYPDVGLKEDFKYQLDTNEDLIVGEEFDYRVGSFIKYPVLHPRVKTYLGLLKKFFGIVLKIEEIKYNAIDLIPINHNDIAIFIATNLAEDINSEYDLIHKVNHNVNFLHGNLMSRLAVAYNWLDLQNDYDDETGEYISDIDEDNMANDTLYFSFYKRDRALRFQSLMSARLDRINESILSLNKLHNPTNYKFEKEDFENAYKSINESLSNFESKYKSYFDTKVFKAKDKVIEENERLRKELEQLKKARKGEKK